MKKEERARARKGKDPEQKKIKTGGFVDEIYEDELDEPVKHWKQETIQTATSEAHELLSKRLQQATADVPVKQEESVQTKPDAGDRHMEPVSGKTAVMCIRQT